MFWDYEIDRLILEEEGWGDLAAKGFDAPRQFAAFMHTLRWNCVTATDANLLQAPFRAGIKIDAYQMEPLRKAVQLPPASQGAGQRDTCRCVPREKGAHPTTQKGGASPDNQAAKALQQGPRGVRLLLFITTNLLGNQTVPLLLIDNSPYSGVTQSGMQAIASISTSMSSPNAPAPRAVRAGGALGK